MAPRASRRQKPKLGVFKFASCDGCQLSLLDCEDELLSLAEVLHFANFAEATSQILPGPYDLALVEGSITTAHDAARIVELRRQSRFLCTIGACATSGGIQALRNFADVAEFTSHVYAHPEYISTLAESKAISAYVKVDYELHGCPINKAQLLDVIRAFLDGRRPRIASHSVCHECKLAGHVCVMVASGTPCLGPVTHAGCGALCPQYNRGCYGCYGPKETPNLPSLGSHWQGPLLQPKESLLRALRTYNLGAEPFLHASRRYESQSPSQPSSPVAGEPAKLATQRGDERG